MSAGSLNNKYTGINSVTSMIDTSLFALNLILKLKSCQRYVADSFTRYASRLYDLIITTLVVVRLLLLV